MVRVKLHFFGTPQVEVDGEPVLLSRRKSMALLAYLAVTAVPHTRDYLAALFWPEFDQSHALAYLRRALWELNHVLGGDYIQKDREQVCFPINPAVLVDVALFQELSVASKKVVLTEAIALYRGDFLAGFTLRDSAVFDDWQYNQREGYRQRLVGCLQDLVALLVAEEEVETAVSYARQWIVLDNLNEEAYRQLMRIYAHLGKRSAAIRQYEKCAAILEEVLRITPETATVTLLDQIKQGTTSILFPVKSASELSVGINVGESGRVCNLPYFSTSFVGRNIELQEINALIESPDTRLLTLVGPGGSGKTRLAVQATSRYETETSAFFPNGVVFVPLESVQTPDAVLSSLVTALDLRFFNEGSNLRAKLIDYLSLQNMLLVFDNYEHLLTEDGLQLLLEILAQASDVKILVTSRERINIRGEQLYYVSGMQRPSLEDNTASPHQLAQANSFSAVQLFQQRARDVKLNFRLAADNIMAVVKICDVVEGMPLAIELAASWLTILTPEEILFEIERSFDFLTADQFDLPDRQRSLRAVFEHSWALLPTLEQSIYKQLSFFRGSFTREAAQAVTNASLQDLMRLVNKSLLWCHENGRFQQHALLREFATEKLNAEKQLKTQVVTRFGVYFISYFLQQTDLIKKSGQKEHFDSIEVEIDHLYRAWLWSVSQKDYQKVFKTLDGIYLFNKARAGKSKFSDMLQEGIILMESFFHTGKPSKIAEITLIAMMIYFAESKGGDPNSRQPRKWAGKALSLLKKKNLFEDLGFAYTLLAIMWLNWYGYEDAHAYLEQSLSLIRTKGKPHELILTLINLGGNLTGSDQTKQAGDYLQEAITLSRRMSNKWFLGLSLLNLGLLESRMRLYEQAIQTFQDCLAILQKLEASPRISLIHWRMGDVFDAIGQYQQAIDAYQKGCEVYVQMKAWRLVASSYSWQSIFAAHLGELKFAENKRQQSLTLAEKIGDKGGVAWAYWEWGELCRIQAKYDQARHYYEYSLTLFQEIKVELGLAYYHRGVGELALQQRKLEDSLAHYTQSQTILNTISNPVERSWALAYVQCGLGRLLSQQKNMEAAKNCFCDAFSNAARFNTYGLLLYILAGVVEFYFASSRYKEAVSLGAFIVKHSATYWETQKRLQELLNVIEEMYNVDEKTAVLMKEEQSLVEVVEIVRGDLQRA